MEQIILAKHAVSQELWDLLVAIMSDSVFADFFLVGGTALSLKLGHRQSDDIDLFCTGNFDATLVEKHLLKHFEIKRSYCELNRVSVFSGEVKIDILAHTCPLLGEIECIEGIRFASLKDIAAMKLNAISGRGLKKDFWDIATLLNIFTLQEMIGFFETKYAQSDTWHLLRSLSYFADAERDETPLINLGQTTWNQVKIAVLKAISKVVV